LEGRFEILEVEPEAPRDQWRNEFKPELKAEGYSRCTIALEPTGGAMKLTITHTAPPRIRSQPNRWIKGFPTAAVRAKFARALSAFLASAPRREPKCRHKPSIALFVTKPTHELPSVRIPQGHRISQGAKLFWVDSLARPNWGLRKTRDFLAEPGNCDSLPGLDTVDQSAQMGFSVGETDGIHFAS
jgi:hypothetical protein